MGMVAVSVPISSETTYISMSFKSHVSQEIQRKQLSKDFKKQKKLSLTKFITLKQKLSLIKVDLAPLLF